MKQNGLLDTERTQQEKIVSKETPVIQMKPKENAPLQVAMAKMNGSAVKGNEQCPQEQMLQPNLKRSSGLRL